jgi:DNA-binding XRE family transcriptional regulator
MTELEFGDRVRTYRKSKNLTQQELAERLGVSDKSVSRWENGSYPDVSMLGPLAKELGVTVDDLLGTAPPLRTLGQSDVQNWLSFGFAMGGGILFFLLSLFLPMLLCYAAYLGLMAYGVYLQKNYTFHSKWFHVGNLVMNFFVNLEIAQALILLFLMLDGLAVTEESLQEIAVQLFSGRFGMKYLLLLAIRPLLALGITALTGWLISRWWHGGAVPYTGFKLRFSPKNLSPAKLLPAIFPLILAGYWTLFSADTAILPIWVYQRQGAVFMALWLISMAVTAAVLLRRHRWTLIPAGVMLLLTLQFPRACKTLRAIGTGTGNLYDYTNRLNPDNYLSFLEPNSPILVLAAIFSAVYLLICCLNVQKSPPEEENPGKNAGM